MTAFVLAFSPVFTALFGVLFAAVVALRPPGLPLSVRVPQSHANDPVVLTAVRRFRWGLALIWVITAALTVGLAAAAQSALAIALPVLLYAALSLVVLVLSRRTIIRAKRQGDWFAGVPVRMSAQLTPPAPHHAPVLWPALALIVLAVAAAIDAAVYPTLPNPIPVHYALSGQADGWAPLSVWSVFGLLIIGAFVAVLLAALSIVAARYNVRTESEDTAEQAALRTQVQRGMLSSLLAQLSFVVALGIAGIDLSRRLLPGVNWIVAVCSVALVVLIMVVVISNVAWGRRQLVAANRRDPRNSRPDAVDDDEHWKGGLLYWNRDDPAVVVPRRFGLGWTFNLGRPAGLAVTILLLLAIAAGVVRLILVAHGV